MERRLGDSYREQMSEGEMSYEKRMSAVATITTELERCEDVDKALTLYEEAARHLDECKKKIDAAQGRFEELTRGKVA